MNGPVPTTGTGLSRFLQLLRTYMAARRLLIEELITTSQSLQDAYLELAEFKAVEYESRVRGWAEAPDDRLDARRHLAEFQALSPSLDRIRLEGSVRQLEERRDLLRFQIQVGVFE